MELCNKCKFYKKDYDEFRKNFVDTEDPEPLHFCCCYDDHIPEKIVNDEMDCEFILE